MEDNVSKDGVEERRGGGTGGEKQWKGGGTIGGESEKKRLRKGVRRTERR